jgi:hypothetical protein
VLPRLSGTHGLQRSGVGNWLYLADWYGGGTKRLISSHLACFHAGNFIFVGIFMHSLFRRETDGPRDKGRKIAEEPNHRRVRLGIERGVLEHLRGFAVSFTFHSMQGACSLVLVPELVPRCSLGKPLTETSPGPLLPQRRRHTTR